MNENLAKTNSNKTSSNKLASELDSKPGFKVGLFLPCYVNHFYPELGVKSYLFLKKAGYRVFFPPQQTCCGQPMANAGYNRENKKIYEKFFNEFKDYDYIVSPSASCVYHLKKYFFLRDSQMKVKFLAKVHEITDFLINVHGLKKLAKDTLPQNITRIGVHQSCHSLRGLHQAKASEMVQQKPFSNLVFLLNMLNGVKILLPAREDQCCGFGGLFSVDEAEVSHKMGISRLEEHQRNRVDVICSGDVSCLMHLKGIIERKKLTIETKHIMELIA